MNDIVSYLLANTYSSFAPLTNTASAVCSLNGQIIPCEDLAGFLGPVIAFGTTMFAIWLIIIVLMIVAVWKLYVKAGQPGWAAIIPFYNIIVLLRIIGKPWWLIFLMFVPIVNIVYSLVVVYNTAKVFGKGVGYTFGLIFLPFIFYPILAFGDATYTPPTQS